MHIHENWIWYPDFVPHTACEYVKDPIRFESETKIQRHGGATGINSLSAAHEIRIINLMDDHKVLTE